VLQTAIYAQGLVEFDYELDAYYSNVSAFIDLNKDEEIPDASDKSELEIYKDLLFHTLHPNIFLVEAAIYPMSIGGLYFRKRNEDLYERAKLQESNIVKLLSAGFNTPYSCSFFFGRMLVFKNKKTTENIGNNRAYIGYLSSYGDTTIKDNRAYFDKWFEFEFKLKGTRKQEDRDLDWSFRVGSRFHENNNFVNSVYVGARRRSIDYKKSSYSFIYNSAFNATLSLSAETLSMIGAAFTVEKIIPLPFAFKSSFGLEVGYIYNSGDKYRGILKEEGVDNHQFVFRPNIKF